MDKETVLLRIRESGVVAVVRAETSDQALRISEACLAGGVSAIEVTFTVPRAHDVIADLAKRFSANEILLGAGSVLDPETARIAILEGANYIVSPCLNLETLRLCNRYRVACMPGAMTVAEVVAALEGGADIIKVFPGEVAGPAFIKGVRGPLPQARLMPTGGVSLDNVATWIGAGAVAIGVGGQLTAGALTGDYTKVTKTARQFIEAVRTARTET
ncbi:MAG: bifunctional 2-keto-4-hydroxyglutarate aldolase/2-keto-3-deoxy-6-phosphogluconate aldolase [Spirochaetales bacterium]